MVVREALSFRPGHLFLVAGQKFHVLTPDSPKLSPLPRRDRVGIHPEPLFGVPRFLLGTRSPQTIFPVCFSLIQVSLLSIWRGPA